jgi:hypothetical protein
MNLPFRTSTYVLIVGGLLLSICMGTVATPAYHNGTIVGLIALVFFSVMGVVTGIALLRQDSPKLCLLNFLLIALFVSLLSAAFVHRCHFIIEHRMMLHIFSLERALQKEGVPFKPFVDLR